MPFSYAEPRRMPLGLGDLYLNNVFVGQLKGNVNLHIQEKYAYARPGNMIADVKADRIMEDMTLTAEVCELKFSQLRTAIGINQAETASASTTSIRKRQQITLVSTTAVTTAATIIAGTLKVLKLDRSTTYVSGTDYTATSTLITRKGSSITSGQNVFIEYNAQPASRSVQVGGELTTPNTFDLLFTHELQDGKTVQVEMYKVMVNTDFQIAFHERSSGNYTTYNITFKALVDETRLEGNQLGQITEEGAS